AWLALTRVTFFPYTTLFRSEKEHVVVPRRSHCGRTDGRRGRSRRHAFVKPAMATIDPSARIEAGAIIGEGASIGPFCIVGPNVRSEEHTSELQSRENLVCRL